MRCLCDRLAPWIFGAGMTALLLAGLSTPPAYKGVKCDLSRYVPGLVVPSRPGKA